MKKHVKFLYEGRFKLEGNDSNKSKEAEIASRLMRGYNICTRNIQSKNREIAKRSIKDIKPLYEQLSDRKKYIVNKTINRLLRKEDTEQLFGLYFSTYLKSLKMTSYELTSYIDAKYQCDIVLGKRDDKKCLSFEDIRSKIDNFKKIKKPQDKSFDLLSEISNILSVDISLLETGAGKKYRINYDYLEKIFFDKNIDKKTFFNRVIDERLYCKKCERFKKCDFQDNYIEYLILNQFELGQIIAQLLNINCEDIVICENIQIELDQYPLLEYFIKLSDNEQKAIIGLICDLHMLRE